VAIRLFELGFVLKAVDQMSGVIRGVEEKVEGLNTAFKNTERWRETSGHLAMVGAGLVAAGAAIGLPLKDSIEAADQLEDHMARLATAIGDVPDKASQLEAATRFVQDQAIATGYDVNQLTESIYQGVSGFLSMSQAMAVSVEAAKLARGTSGDLTDTTSALTTMMLNFGDATKTPIQNATMLADKMAALQTQFKFSNLTDLTYAMQDAAPAALGFGVNLDQLMGSLATLSAGGLSGETSGEAFLEILTQLSRASGKLGFQIFQNANGHGIDLLRTLEGIKARYGDIAADPRVSAEFEKAFGARAGSRIALLLQHLDKFKQAMGGVQNSAGATDRAFEEFNQRGSLVFTRLHQAISTIEIALGTALLPIVEGLARGLLWVATAVHNFATAHPQITKFIALFAAISAIALVVVGGVALIAGALGFLASVIIPVAGYLGISAGLFAAISVAAAAAAAAIITWWGQIRSFFTTMIPQAFNWGVNLLKTFASGIKAAAMWPIREVENVLTRIRAHLPFSPAKVGPLRDLHRIRLMETIAETMQPAPMLNAIRRVAAVTAIAAPMMVGGAAVGSAAPAASGITVNYAPNVVIHADGGDGRSIEAAVMKALREHRRELAEEIDRVMARRDRTRF
jgi:TP901 family phage tail tape measure protein